MRISLKNALSSIWRVVGEANFSQSSVIANSVSDRLVLHRFRVQGKFAKTLKIILVIWVAPFPGWIVR